MPKKTNRPKRDIKPVFHIYCEGEKTEPNYLNGYIEKFCSTARRLKVIKIEPTKKNTPKELVQVAIAAKKSTPKDDIFWVVYDRESEQKYTDQFHADAYIKAQKHHVFLAISNVCFEAWLLLHFQDTNASYSCYDDLRNTSDLRTECKKRGVPDYDKGNKAIFSILKEDEIKEARNRAKRINMQTQKCADPSRIKPYQWNPYTDIYKLLDAIDEHAKK